MNVQFSEGDITEKAVHLGVIREGETLPRHKRSAVVAALLQEAVGASVKQAPVEPELANEVTVHAGGAILVNGEPFPWLVSRQAMEIGLDPDGVSTVRLTLMAKSVQILKPEPREESEQK